MGEPEDDPDADSEDEHRPELSARGKSARGKDGDGKDDVDETFSERIVKALQDGSGDQTAEELLTEVRQMGAAVAELAAAVHALKASRPTTVRLAAVRRPDRRTRRAARQQRRMKQVWWSSGRSLHRRQTTTTTSSLLLRLRFRRRTRRSIITRCSRRRTIAAMDGRQKRASTPPAPSPRGRPLLAASRRSSRPWTRGSVRS